MISIERIIDMHANNFELIGTSNRIGKIHHLIKKIAPHTNVDVLIEGETGTGKELVARSIHYYSPNRDKKFIAINCTAIPHELVESEFFGHEKGSFTSAVSSRIGKFEAVSDGSLLLDEIGDMDFSLQAKILRVLENREFTRVGRNEPIHFKGRIIATTNKVLIDRVRTGEFRADLFYRLFQFMISIPPLRERKEDVPLLANYFLSKAKEQIKKNVQRINPHAMDMLIRHDWPGNVRELKHVITKAVILAEKNEISQKDVLTINELPNKKNEFTISLDRPLEEIEKHVIMNTLCYYNNNKKRVAKSLGISEATLYRKMKKINHLT